MKTFDAGFRGKAGRHCLVLLSLWLMMQAIFLGGVSGDDGSGAPAPRPSVSMDGAPNDRPVLIKPASDQFTDREQEFIDTMADLGYRIDKTPDGTYQAVPLSPQHHRHHHHHHKPQDSQNVSGEQDGNNAKEGQKSLTGTAPHLGILPPGIGNGNGNGRGTASTSDSAPAPEEQAKPEPVPSKPGDAPATPAPDTSSSSPNTPAAASHSSDPTSMGSKSSSGDSPASSGSGTSDSTNGPTSSSSSSSSSSMAGMPGMNGTSSMSMDPKNTSSTNSNQAAGKGAALGVGQNATRPPPNTTSHSAARAFTDPFESGSFIAATVVTGFVLGVLLIVM
ncbi:hypothetical protein BCV70DRAFT_218906 [Testicularia cyperi]|uniref:Uncharacterized protein n=1 Tax=Testicularia cyperi TaxID=1882483 RepID=A0A317XII2_9BASI|nr:hypothetical protein BCV70DRAFT_218906 [Testicularia cyperi]